MDDLAGNIFEMALPGAKGAQATKSVMAGHNAPQSSHLGHSPSDGGGRGVGGGKQLSPGSDTLGREIRRHHSGDEQEDHGGGGRGGRRGGGVEYEDDNDYYDRNHGGGGHGGGGRQAQVNPVTALIGDAGYKSKFMQQYASPVPSNGRKQYNNYDDEREDARSSGGGGDSGHADRRSNPPTQHHPQPRQHQQQYDDYDEPVQPVRQQQRTHGQSHARDKPEPAAREQKPRPSAQPDRRHANADVEAEDDFLSSLRGGGGAGDRSDKNKPSWNDDLSAKSDIFGAPPPLRGAKKAAIQVTSKVDSRREPSRDMADRDRDRKRGGGGYSQQAGYGSSSQKPQVNQRQLAADEARASRSNSDAVRNRDGGTRASNNVSGRSINTNVGDDMPLPTQVNKGMSSPNAGFGSEYPEDHYKAKQLSGGGGRARQPHEPPQRQRQGTMDRRQDGYRDDRYDTAPKQSSAVQRRAAAASGANNSAQGGYGYKEGYSQHDNYSDNTDDSDAIDPYDEPHARFKKVASGHGHGQYDPSPHIQKSTSPRGQLQQRAGTGQGEPVTHARSRLSLLKNKIRLSENSTGSRTNSASGSRSEGLQRSHSAYDNEFPNMNYGGDGREDYMLSPRDQPKQPKTAPSRHRAAPPPRSKYSDEDEEDVSPYDSSEYQQAPKRSIANNKDRAKPKFRVPDDYQDDQYAAPYQPYEAPPAKGSDRSKSNFVNQQGHQGTGGGGGVIGAGTGIFSADIYSAAADMPGAYPDGENAPKPSNISSQPRREQEPRAHPSNKKSKAAAPAAEQRSQSGRREGSSYGASRFEDDEDWEEEEEDYQPAPRRGQAGGSRHKPPPQQEYSSYGGSGGGGGMDSEYPDDDAYGGENINQIECPDCGRKFNPEPYKRHAKVCTKVFGQKRKTFDSKKMRIMAIAEQAPEITKLAKEAARSSKRSSTGGRTQGRGQDAPLGHGGAAGGQNAGKSKWAEQSKAFRDAMKQSRAVSNAIATGQKIPDFKPSAPDPNMVPCPHCNRTFNAKAADRHIPQCQNIKAQPKSLKAGSGHGAVARAVSGKSSKRGVQF